MKNKFNIFLLIIGICLLILCDKYSNTKMLPIKLEYNTISDFLNIFIKKNINYQKKFWQEVNPQNKKYLIENLISNATNKNQHKLFNINLIGTSTKETIISLSESIYNINLIVVKKSNNNLYYIDSFSSGCFVYPEETTKINYKMKLYNLSKEDMSCIYIPFQGIHGTGVNEITFKLFKVSSEGIKLLLKHPISGWLYSSSNKQKLSYYGKLNTLSLGNNSIKNLLLELTFKKTDLEEKKIFFSKTINLTFEYDAASEEYKLNNESVLLAKKIDLYSKNSISVNLPAIFAKIEK